MAYEEHGDGHGYARGNVQNKTAGTYGYACGRRQHRGGQRITEGRATSTTGSGTRRLDADVHGCEVEGVDQVHAGLDYWLLEARTTTGRTAAINGFDDGRTGSGEFEAFAPYQWRIQRRGRGNGGGARREN